MSAKRVAALRALMAKQSKALTAYIVPTADAHNSEYISPTDARREWLSGFTGSAGTAVVTQNEALVWTDGRYYVQFEQETDTKLWTLMKQSLPDTLTMEKWLSSNLPEGSVVGADPTTMKRDDWTPLKTALTKVKVQLLSIKENLVDAVRIEMGDPPPPRPFNPLITMPLKFSGKSAGQKISELREKMLAKKAAILVISALDEVAYTLNLRGADIEYNPVFFSYLVISNENIVIFWHDGQLPKDILKHLAEEKVGEIVCKPYEDVFDFLAGSAKKLLENENEKNSSVWLSHDGSEALHIAASGGEDIKAPMTLLSEVSPVALAKLVKNEHELKGFRDCHVRDGVAVIRFFRWLHKETVAGANITEVQAADKLLEFRKDEEYFMGPSFSTIAGAGANGAIIHYTASRDGPQTVIQKDDMFLLDSGGQYMDGTTDITRTRHMGKPSAEQVDAFTRVLKGQMMVGSALFPSGVKGNVLDSFARKALWDIGLDYGHGTGHGVGHFLNVHEGPSGVSWRPYPDDPGLKPAHILSNEPGYYKVGEYGIRHEDLVEIVEVKKDSDHIKAKTLVGDYDGRGVLGFRTLTMVPHQRDCIDADLLDDFELTYLNAYHKRVLDTVGLVLQKRGLLEDLAWLQEECQPISRRT